MEPLEEQNSAKFNNYFLFRYALPISKKHIPTISVQVILTLPKTFVSGRKQIQQLFSFQIRIAHFKKTYTNHFRPGYFDITQDFCEWSKTNSAVHTYLRTFFNNLYPSTFDQMDKVLHDCPYTVQYSEDTSGFQL
jgi:hypothetical protein